MDREVATLSGELHAIIRATNAIEERIVRDIALSGAAWREVSLDPEDCFIIMPLKLEAEDGT